MELYFPIEAVDIELVTKEPDRLDHPKHSMSFMDVSDDSFFLRVRDVASYSAMKGKKIVVYPHKGADAASVNLFLNGSVFGALLHQQNLMPFHGSSFIFDGRGIMICGHAGAGKSSITVAFGLDGGVFVNDDITPVKVIGNEAVMMPIHTRIKLWSDSMAKLNIPNDQFEKIRPSLDKFYVPTSNSCKLEHRLDHVVLLCLHNRDYYEAIELNGLDKFDALRRQIYRKGYLKGMPSCEKSYFSQLLNLSKAVRVTTIVRPDHCSIQDTVDFIRKQFRQ